MTQHYTYRMRHLCSGLLCLLASACAALNAQTPQAPFSVAVANSFIARVPDPDSIHWPGQPNSFSWQAGYIMFAMEKMYRATGDTTYLAYIRKYADRHVDDRGNVPVFSNTALDNFLPGYALLCMYEQTRSDKYRIAAMNVRAGFRTYPRNADSSFWHATWARHQMWVDGVFMGGIFLARYESVIGDSGRAFNEATLQMTLALQHCLKPNGLLLHGWDESKKARWADPATGAAAEVWSEGLGWYAVLMADVFDYLPRSHPRYQPLMRALQDLCRGLKQVQDPRTGMWCQVVDKPGEPDNWNETSGTGMFLYLIKRSIDKGYIPSDEYAPVATNAYQGIIKKTRMNARGLIDLVDCSSIGIQKDYKEYVAQPHEVSPFAAFGSFIIGTGIMEQSRTGAMQTIELPPAQKTGGMPLMEALSKRASVRSFDTTAIALQQLSDLLWASFGVSRPDGRRTAPSANNKQEIDLYVLLRTGAYLYDARAHRLVLVTPEDLRGVASEQRFAEAPVQLIYVADLARRGSSDDGAIRMANMDCGYISQNTYLYCASAGLVTGARATVNRDALAPRLKLKPDQRILLAHSVGHPKQ